MEKYNYDIPRMNTGLRILKLISTFFQIIKKWFNKLDSNIQLGIIKHSLEYHWNIKNIVPILIKALSKSRDLKYAAVQALEMLGPAVIQSVPDLQKAYKATRDEELKIKIEDAIRIIENK